MWKLVFVEGDDGKWVRFLVVNKLKGRVLIMEERQIKFGKLGTNEVENSDGDNKG